MANNNPTFKKGLGAFEDLENVSEMVAETSELSKDHQSKSATSENNTCMCTYRICKFVISAEKGTFQLETCLAMLYKQWTMSRLHPSNSGCTWIVVRALR